MMIHKRTQSGWTLVELMVTVGILGVLAGIAIPTYDGYVRSGEIAVAATNAETLAGFEDTYFYENGGYLAGTYEPGGTDDLTAPLGWNPTDKGRFKYVVTTGGCTAPVTQCYTITVTQIADPTITHTMSRP